MIIRDTKTNAKYDYGDSLGGDLIGLTMILGPTIWRIVKKIDFVKLSAKTRGLYKFLFPICIVLEIFTIIIGKARPEDIFFFLYLFIAYRNSIVNTRKMQLRNEETNI